MTPESVTLRLGSERVQVAFGTPVLTAGTGAHWLTYDVTLTPSWVDPADGHGASTTPMHLAGTLWCTNTGMRRVSDLAPQVVALHGFTSRETLAFPLTTEQVLAVDGARLDGALQLNLKLSAALLGPRAGAHGQTHEEATLRIEPEHWLGSSTCSAQRCHYCCACPHRCWTRARPPCRPRDRWPTRLRRAPRPRQARQARQELRDGRYEASVRSSRLAMESLGMLSPLPPAKPLHAKPATQRGPYERWAVFRYALYGLASGDAHDDGPTAAVEWSRADAEAVLVATGALLTRHVR